MDDLALLRQFAEGDSASFTSLVDRHIGLVYSAALRQTGNATLADDITQTVFIILARKAGKISDRTVVAGWLYRTTGFVAAKAVRAETRRHQREQEAAQMYVAESTDPNWHELAPVLDDAMSELAETDRDALLLRYFENRSLEQVGRAFGISDDAAQKRVTRALDKLRRQFARKKLVVPAIALASVLASNAVHAAPIATRAAVVATATNQSVLSISVYSLVKSSLQQLFWGKVAGAGAVAAIVLSGVIFYYQLPQQQTGSPKSSVESQFVPVAPMASEQIVVSGPRPIGINMPKVAPTASMVSPVPLVPSRVTPVPAATNSRLQIPQLSGTPTNSSPSNMRPIQDLAVGTTSSNSRRNLPIDTSFGRNNRNSSPRNSGINVNRR